MRKSADKLQIKRSAHSIVISNKLFFYEIAQKTAGFPQKIGFQESKEVLFNEEKPMLRAKLNNKLIFPSLDHSFNPEIIGSKDSLKIIFNDIKWKDETGRHIESYRLSLYYEIHMDGVAFIKSFFYTKTTEPGNIQNFILEPHIKLSDKQDGNWAYWKFPESVDGNIIQTAYGFERNLSIKENRKFDKTILPFISFDFGNNGKRDKHLEFFLESYNSLAPDHRNTETEISWNNKKATVKWNFQKKPEKIKGRPYQWRNCWGWAIRKFPVERKLPPLRVFHYFDLLKPYPDAKMIRQSSLQGANLFILHENWRLDLKHGEFPENIELLKKTIKNCHKYNMRVALYVRGNEDNIKEAFAEYLRPYLKKNWDGIYMDYGGPINWKTIDEQAPGGRIHFREFYKMSKKIREFVGEEGIYISHSGSFFSAIGQTTVSAYLCGEQEKGLLIKDKTAHAYFSGLSVASSSLWTGAFPTYRSRKALPYFASTAQFPFLHLGTQVPTSSLDHPRVPSVITFARPLWRLWELFDGKKDIKVYTMQNTENVFQTDSNDTQVSVMVDKENNVLLIASNFSAQERNIKIKPNLAKLKINPAKTCFCLHCNYEKNDFKEVKFSNNLRQKVEGYGLKGWLFTGNKNDWTKKLEHFVRPYVSFKKDEEEYYKRIKKIKDNRFNPPLWERCYLRVSTPNWPNTWEESVWWHLFQNTIELWDMTNPQKPKKLGYVSKKGFSSNIPKEKDYIWPGVKTSWIPLHNLIKPGKEKITCLGLASRREGKENYSLIKGVLSPVPYLDKKSYEIIYNNEIDSDWSLLTFNIWLPRITCAVQAVP